jgi:PD-(D/E)XK nuclease superfamily
MAHGAETGRFCLSQFESRKHESTKTRKKAIMAHEFEELSSKVLAAAIDVHKALGPGFVEPIYQKAMEVALQHRAIPFVLS